MSKKKLVSLRNVDEYITDNTLIIKNNMLISPGVKDYLRNKKVTLTYESTKEIASDKKLVNHKDAIKKILKKDFNITDTLLINKIVKMVEEKI